MPVALFASAYALRLAYLHQIAETPFFDFLQLDPLYYHDWALSIVEGDWIGREVFEQSPLYPYLLSLYMLLFGRDLWVLRLIQIGVGSLTSVLTYLLGARLFDKRVGLLAGMGCAAYGPFFFYEGQVMKEFLTPPLATAALILLVRSRQGDRDGFAALPLALAGALIGLAALVRDNFLLLFAAVGVWVLYECRWSLRGSLPLAAGLAIVLLPVAIRNYAVSGDLILTTSGGGEVFYIGNGPYANGAYVPPPWVRSNPRFEHEDFRRKAQEMTGRELTRAEASRFWWRQGLSWIAQNPIEASLLWLRKLALFWNDHELPDNYSYDSFRRFSWLLAILPTFGPVAALASAGAVLSAGRWRRLMPAFVFAGGYLLSVLVFFNFARFRLPVIPILLVLAGRGLAGLWEAATASRGRRLARGAPLLATVVLVVSIPLLYADLSGDAEEPFQDRLHLGAAFRQAGRLEEAERTLREVIADAEAVGTRHGGDPRRPSSLPGGLTFVLSLAAAHRDLAGVLVDRGDLEGAIAEYRRSSDLSPDDADLQLKLCGALRAARHLAQAERACRRAVQLAPDSFSARFDLATIQYEAGHLEEALSVLEAGRQAAPPPGPLDLADWHYGMGTVLQAMPGRLQEAAGHFEEALRLNPHGPQSDQARRFLDDLETPPRPSQD